MLSKVGNRSIIRVSFFHVWKGGTEAVDGGVGANGGGC